MNVQRTVRTFERVGATAIQLEDQSLPKRCGHLAGKTLVSADEMVGKIKAALDVRNDALIVARTDAIAVEGIDAALDRASMYLDAGGGCVVRRSAAGRRTDRRDHVPVGWAGSLTGQYG